MWMEIEMDELQSFGMQKLKCHIYFSNMQAGRKVRRRIPREVAWVSRWMEWHLLELKSQEKSCVVIKGVDSKGF